ncbi:MAG: sulfatase family protein [Chloroflexota bacterium]
MADTPNILVVMADDHGQWASGPYGNRDLRTPAMDYLARRGVRMADAFTPTPVCSPARASFFTGRLPSQHGIQDYLMEVDMPDKDWLAGETTLPQLLQGAGYQTALVGKWHCGRSWLTPPGFDYWISYQANQQPHRGTQRFVENGTPVVHEGYQTPFLTGKALRLLRERDRARPFFLFVGYVDTHSPFAEHPDRLVSAYRQAGITDMPLEEADTTRGWTRMLAPREPAERRERLAQYYAAVTMIDEQVGALLDDLEGRGELANTLVIYTADHGHMNGQHGLYTKGNATVPQNFYEESIRIPALLCWPDHFPAGQVRAEPVDHLDLFQTLLDVTHCRLDPAFVAERRYPGRSYLPMLEGRPIDWRREQFGEYGNARMLRTEQYKLVRHYAPHAGVYPDELYDLTADPRETQNRIGNPALADTIRTLDTRLEEHFARYEQPERSAKNILSQPLCNRVEPWRIEPGPLS